MTLRVVVGVDKSERAGTYAFMESVQDLASRPVSFILLTQDVLRRANIYWREELPEFATQFSMSRWLSPFLVDFKGPVLFADGADMIARSDIAELWDTVPTGVDCAVVKHDYTPKAHNKFGKLNAPQVAYRRKLWSSLVFFWANTPACQRLTPKRINESSGAYLHQFGWLTPDNVNPQHDAVLTDEQRIESRVYGLHEKWNWIPNHSEERVDFADAAIVHWTEGSACQLDGEIPYKELWQKYHKQAASLE